MFKFLRRLFGGDAASSGNMLAQELARRYPLTLDGKGMPRISADRLSKILEKVYRNAQSIQADKKFSYFHKTRLCHAFKWHLLDSGYSREFVDLATEGLVVYLSKPYIPFNPAQDAQSQSKAQEIRRN